MLVKTWHIDIFICPQNSFRMSIDGHKMHIIATDGYDVEDMEVDALIIAAAERFDFWVDTTDPQGLGSYTIRVEATDVRLICSNYLYCSFDHLHLE